MTAEDFLNQYDPSNKRSVSQEPAFSTTSFLDQYDPSINKNLEPESSGILRQAADIPVKFAQGAVGSVKNFTDLLGADNPASKELAGYEKWIGSLVSAESKKDDQEIARIFKDAENKGVYDKVIAGLEAFSKAPLEMAAQSAGYMVPQLAAGALGKAAQLGRAGILGAQLATGFAQGVGTIKGDIYDSTKDYLREKGVPEDKIESIASKAQAYNGGNLDQMLIGGGLMAADALGGAEAILTRVLTKQGKAASGGIIKGILKGGLEEALIEIPQEGQEQVASNLALQRLGYDVSTFKGVPERAAMAGAAGFAMGGALGGIEALSPEQKEQKDIDKEAERRARDLESTDPATQAVSTELTRLERGIDNKRQDLDALESNSPEASKLRLDIAADQKNLAVLKEQANKLGLSETITEAEKQQIALANLIAAEPNPAKLLAMPSIAEQEAGIAYGGEPGLYDVFGSITRKPVSIPKPAELPAAPTIEEQTAEGTYGGQTGVFDVFAGARRKPVEAAPTIAEAASVEPTTPAPVTEQAAPAEAPATKQSIASATNVANQIEEENKVLEQQKKFSPPTAPTLQDARSLPDAVAKKGKTLSISGGKQERNILDPKESKKRFDEIGYERQALELPEDMNDRVSGRYGNAIANIKSLYSLQWLGAHFHGGVAVNPDVKGTQRGRIVAHELGHASHSLLGDKINKDQNVLNELQAIEELLYPGLRAKVSAASNPDASFFNYLLSPNELIAEFNVERVSNPERAAQVAPALSALLESAENMKGLVADRKAFPTFMGVISESKERLKVKDLESRRIREVSKDALASKYKQWSDTAKWLLKWGREGKLKNLIAAKTALSNLRNVYKAPKSFAKRAAELTGNQELIDYVEELYPAEPATTKPTTPAPVTEQAAPAEAPAPEVAPAEQAEMPKDFEITGKQITKISTENGIESATKDYASALNKKGIKTEISYDVTTTIGFDTVTKTKKRITSNDNVSSGNIITPQGKLVILSDGSVNVFKPTAPTPAVSETITEPKLGEKGGVLIPTKEDFIQAGQNIYEAGMEFGAWAKQMIQQFGDAVREFLGEVWQVVSGAPAKFNELMGYLPKKGETGAVNVGGGKLGGKTQAVAEPAPTGKPEEIMSQEVGPPKTTPEGIIAKTKELLRKQFDPAKVSVNNTTEAFRALGRLTGKDANAFAQELNDIGRLVDKSGAASEISMGAALFVNDLFEYSIRLAAEGDSKMLGIMIANINKLPTAGIGASDAGRTLRARLELSQRFRMMGDAEQDSYTNYVAEFIYGPNPTKDQIQSIKDAYVAVEKTPQVTEQELTDEIKAVGDRAGTDLVGKINEEFTKATEKGKEKRKTEEAELDEEYKKVQKQADAEIEKLAKIQSDTPSFDSAAARQITNDVRAIVANDLKQRPDMGRKAPWKSLLVAKLQEAGVEVAAAETLADIVWRQHEINNLSRELSSINKAVEKGPISEIVKAIKETPLEDQQNPNWRYEVMRDYLRRAGLNVAQAERIAKLMDISLQKRFTMAQEQAFTDAISKSAPWKTGDTRSRRAFQKVLQALRAGALDPARNVLSDMAALNGWTGFTPEQYKALLKNDAILSDPESADATKAEAHKAIQDIISKAKLPIRARDVIGQYYDAQALSGIQTMTVNIFSPAGMAAKNALVQSLNGLVTARPDQITAAMTTFVDSIKSWANTVAYSFKNNVTVYSNVEYLVNDEGLLKLYKKGVDQFNNGKTPRERADGVKNMMVGMMDYVRRVLNALDYGAIASLQNQSVSKYALAAMQAKGMSSKDGAKMLNAMMEEKRIFYTQQIAIGTDKNKAAVLADEFFISAWRQALTDAKLPAQEVIDAALNDAMSAVGRNRQSLDAFLEEETNIRDEGLLSFPAIWLLETMANAANRQDSQFIKIFSRVIYGFAIVPARVLRETAWFSPIGAYRFAYEYIAEKKGLKSRYAQSLGNDLQYRQRLTETIAGSIVMLAFGAAMSASTDDEDDEKPFKIVVTGNGPLRNEDPQYYDSWVKKNRPNTVSVYFGKTKFTLNTMRGFEAFAWPAMMLGAVDDWHIRRKQKRETNTPMQMQDAAIVAGNVLSASLRRGPYSFAAKPLFEAYGDRGVESLAKSLAFPAKTIIPVLGSSLASNISNFLNEPVDRRTLEGALWANVPFIGPAVAPKSLNAFGEPAMANDAADKIFKLGVPIVFDIPTDRDSVNLHELVLKQGGGPSIPTRNQLAQRLDRQPTNKEYEMFAKEYGAVLTTSMKKNYEKLSAMKPEAYTKVVERIGNRARDIAENKVRVAAKKP